MLLHHLFIHVYFIVGTVSGSVAMWLCLVTISIDITGIAKFKGQLQR